MELVTVLQTRLGPKTSVFADNGDLEPSIQGGWVDAFIAPVWDRFSPLRANRAYLARATGIPETELESLVRRNCVTNNGVTLVGVPSRNPASRLRGLVACPSASSDCYRQFAMPFVSRPFRDFYYRVAYEAIAYAVEALGARRLALAPSIEFDESIAACSAEALMSYCEENLGTVDSFTFLQAGTARSLAKVLEKLPAEDEASEGPLRRLRRIFPGHAEIHLDLLSGKRTALAQAAVA
jgi:hypothetical protein